MVYAELAVIAALILLNGLLAMAELAIVTSRPARLKAMAARRIAGAKRALALASDPGRFLSIVQVGISLVGILAGAFSGATLGQRLAAVLASEGIPPGIAVPVAFGIVVAAITYLSLIIGELVPKQIALRRPEQIACKVAPAMAMLSRVATPLVWLLDRSGKLVLSLLGQRAAPDSQVTDEEIRTLIAEAEAVGVIEPEEHRMIRGVMRLGDRPVSAMMTPRHEVDLIDIDAGPSEIARRIAESVHSRLPAYRGNPDEILGVLQAKELADALLMGEKPDYGRLVREAPIIPEIMDAVDVVERLRSSAIHLGLVYDEYGQFQGVITAADILETIVGEFRTVEGPAEAHAVRRSDGSYFISGSMPMDELAELLNLEVPAKRSYHTAAGFVLESLQHLPTVGEAFIAQGWKFEVADLDDRRIDKLIAMPAERRGEPQQT